ncbi:hypothetical protein CcrBL47_gp322 [Caulobacter phage BL47]|nr:hypothetical protein CcrBL47_gp322 [Caulobacter phage BL47]
MSSIDAIHLLTSPSGDNIYLAEEDVDPFATWDPRWKVVRYDRLPCDGRMRQFIGWAGYLTDAKVLAQANLSKMQESS